MNEEIEYAEMLEIPVSTVNVMKKPPRRRKKAQSIPPPQSFTAQQPNNSAFNTNNLSDANTTNDFNHLFNNNKTAPQSPSQDVLQNSVIAQVNDKLNDGFSNEITAEAELFAESANSEGNIDFDSIPQRIDTLRLYSTEDTKHGFFHRRFTSESYPLGEEDMENEFEDDLEDNFKNEGGRYAFNDKNTPSKRVRTALNIEFALACALCGAIFLTNVFMPDSAINTFFRSINEGSTANADTRSYADFTLSAFVSELSDAELDLSPAGVLTFTDACCVYPAANGKISNITKSADGNYRVTIAYSDSFLGVIDGLNQVYYDVGDQVKANVPMGYSDGEKEVQVTMYSNGTLLNCFQLTEENCLAWLEE